MLETFWSNMTRQKTMFKTINCKIYERVICFFSLFSQAYKPLME